MNDEVRFREQESLGVEDLSQHESWAAEHFAGLRPVPSKIDPQLLSFRAGLAAAERGDLALRRGRQVSSHAATSVLSALVGGAACWALLAAIPSLRFDSSAPSTLAIDSLGKSGMTSEGVTSAEIQATRSRDAEALAIDKPSQRNRELEPSDELQPATGRWASIFSSVDERGLADSHTVAPDDSRLETDAIKAEGATQKMFETPPYYRWRQRWQIENSISDFS